MTERVDTEPKHGYVKKNIHRLLSKQRFVIVCSSMKQTREELLTLGMGKLFVKLAIPGVLGTIIIGLYNLMDAVFVGQFVGKEGVGAVAVVYSVVLVNQAISTLIGIGSMSMLSRAIGKKDEKTSRRILGNLVLTVTIPSAVLSVVSFLYARPIVAFFGGSDIMLDLGEKYLKIISLGFILSSVGPAMNMLLRGEGRMKEAMLIAASGMALNIILDPIFIHTLGMGISGAAVATVISQGVYLVTNILYFKYGKSLIKLNIREFKFAFDLMPNILSVGLGGMIGLVMIALQQVILYKSLAYHGGTDQVALMGATFRVFLFAFIPLTGIGQGLQPVIGMNFGANRYSRVREAYKSFTMIASGISGLLWLCFMLFPGAILSWFITDPGLVLSGKSNFRILFGVFFAAGMIINTGIMFQALGKGGHAAILAASRQVLFFIPLVFILPIYTGTTGIWLSLPVTDTLTILLALVLLIVEYRKLLAGYPIHDREFLPASSPEPESTDSE